MSIIKDGTGTGYHVKVSAENRLQATAVTVDTAQHVNEEHQKIFSLPFDAIDPVGADDYFFYVKNTGTKNLHITDFHLRSTVAGTVEVHHVTGTPVYTAQVAVTPVNRYLGDTKSITADIYTDTDTTGLTNQGILNYIRLDTANVDYEFRMHSHIIIPPGQAMALLWDAATGALSGIIEIYEEQPDI